LLGLRVDINTSVYSTTITWLFSIINIKVGLYGLFSVIKIMRLKIKIKVK